MRLVHWLLLIALVTASGAYALAYLDARDRHRLVRYGSGCIVRGGLHPDLWTWPYRCDELRRYLGADGRETAFAPLVGSEELARGRDGVVRSVCELPVMPPPLPAPTPLPTFRPSFCPGALRLTP